ncbi:MAG: hypothetical protein PHS86_15910 [Syntrophaceae bacterium]|nr:hypothetical protein [Syntrophaceae bacterium]
MSDKPKTAIDLELATTGQIMAELAKRNKNFVMIFEPGSGITDKPNAVECHVSHLNPQNTFELLAESAMLMEKIISGEVDPEKCSVQFLQLDEFGDYKIVDFTPQTLSEDMTEEEKGYDPWGGENVSEENDN